MTNDKELSDIPKRKLLALITAQAMFFAVLGLALWSLSGRPLGDFVTFDRDQTIIGLSLAAGMIATAAGTFLLFPRLTDWLVRAQGENFAFLRRKLSFSAIIWISVCAGVSEEALFRAGLQTLLTDYLGPAAAIAISSLVFALIHLAKPAVAGIIFAIGVLFGVVYFYTGSLLTVILAHALYDVFALAYLQRRLHQIGYFSDHAAAPSDTGTENHHA